MSGSRRNTASPSWKTTPSAAWWTFLLSTRKQPPGTKWIQSLRIILRPCSARFHPHRRARSSLPSTRAEGSPRPSWSISLGRRLIFLAHHSPATGRSWRHIFCISKSCAEPGPEGTNGTTFGESPQKTLPPIHGGISAFSNASSAARNLISCRHSITFTTLRAMNTTSPRRERRVEGKTRTYREVAPDTSSSPRLLATSKNPLLHICDLYDTALCLRVLGILHHRHVQFFLALAEGDVCCAITRGDLKYVQQFALRRYLQDFAAEPLGNINVTLAV